MGRTKVYEVFARKAHDEELKHVGSVNAADELQPSPEIPDSAVALTNVPSPLLQ